MYLSRLSQIARMPSAFYISLKMPLLLSFVSYFLKKFIASGYQEWIASFKMKLCFIYYLNTKPNPAQLWITTTQTKLRPAQTKVCTCGAAEEHFREPVLCVSEWENVILDPCQEMCNYVSQKSLNVTNIPGE